MFEQPQDGECWEVEDFHGGRRMAVWSKSYVVWAGGELQLGKHNVRLIRRIPTVEEQERWRAIGDENLSLRSELAEAAEEKTAARIERDRLGDRLGKLAEDLKQARALADKYRSAFLTGVPPAVLDHTFPWEKRDEQVKE